ncbi:MAG: transketolase [Clostridia bacterium]|nr:transketolase [Clostridia bacterium]
MNPLSITAYELRQDVLDIIVSGGGGHIGGDMSSMEIMLALYSRMHISPERPDDPDRDRFVLSKGHCVETLYAVLAWKGFLDLEEVKSLFSRFGSEYIGHPHNTLRGIEMNSGSLGHGLSVCTGMALAGKMDKRDYRVYTLMGDGELAEGSVWEAAMAAGHYKLDNLCAVIDRNHLQISGSTEAVMNPGDIPARFASYGWHVTEVPDGNDIDQINIALDEAGRTHGCPSVIIAHTVKGKGSALMENKASWHHHLPNAEEYDIIRRDLAARKEALIHEQHT